jgi:hypothetical protein
LVQKQKIFCILFSIKFRFLSFGDEASKLIWSAARGSLVELAYQNGIWLCAADQYWSHSQYDHSAQMPGLRRFAAFLADHHARDRRAFMQRWHDALE